MDLRSNPDDRLYVVVGIIPDSKGRLLIQQRRAGTPKAGKWEFPGGKLESGETPIQALTRELQEELSVTVTDCKPLIVINHDYEHARVLLDTYLVESLTGNPTGVEGQNLAWAPLGKISDYDVLEAVHPIVEALVSSNRLGWL